MSALPCLTPQTSHSACGPVLHWSARHSHEGCRDARGTGAALPAPRQGRSTPGRHGRRRTPRTFLLSTVQDTAAAMPANPTSHITSGMSFVSGENGQ